MRSFNFFETEADALRFVKQNRWRKYTLTPWNSKDKNEKIKFVLWH